MKHARRHGCAALVVLCSALLDGELGGVVLGSGLAHADASAELSPAPTLEELQGWARSLGEADAQARSAAFEALSTLGDEALPAIRERLRALDAQHGASGLRAAGDPLSALRAPGDRDVLATRVGEVLDHDRSGPVLLAAELVALTRALEAQRTTEAAQILVAELFALEPRYARSEAASARKQLGRALLPAYLRLRRHADPALRRLARDNLAALGAPTLEQAFQVADAALTVAIIEQLFAANEPELGPWLLSFVDDERAPVQEAARAALANLRPAHAQLLPLYAEHEERRHERGEAPSSNPPSAPPSAFQDAIARVEAALSERAWAAAEAQLEQLSSHPLSHEKGALALDMRASREAERGQLARAYFALGVGFEREALVDRALVAYRRSSRWSVDPADTARSRARVLLLQAERRARAGVADVEALTHATQLDPELAHAAHWLDALKGGPAERAHAMRHKLGLLAAALLASSGLLLLRVRARNAKPPSA